MSDFKDVNIGGPALGVIWTMTGIAGLVVILRLFTQRLIMRSLGLADLLIVFSMLTITGFASLITVQYHFGWGRHYQFLNHHQQLQAIHYNVISQSFGVMGSTWGRLSFIVYMVQIFGTTRFRKYFLWTLFAAQFLTNGAVVITLYTQCNNVKALWNFSIVTYCWPVYVQTYLGYAHSSWNGATDLFLTILPAMIVWKLQMNRKLKLGLACLLGLSLFAFVGVLMKIVKLRALSLKDDYTYNCVSLFTWIIVEGTLVVIAASVPLLRPLYTHFFGKPKTQQGSYELDNKYGRYARYGNQNSVATGQFAKLGSKKSPPSTDTASEEGILPMQSLGAGRVIHKHTSYTVQVSDVDSVEKQSGGVSPVSWAR